MKILQIGKFFPIRGGVEKVMFDLMMGLSEDGVACDMLCAAAEDYPEGEYQLNGLAKLIVVKSQVKLAATMIAPRMISVLKRIATQYDIIHIHHPDPMATLALFLSGYKGKVVLHWHSDILKQKMLLRFYKPLQSWLINRADLILGTTPVYVAESDHLKQVQHKVDYLPIGIEPLKINKQHVERLKSKYQGKKIILSIGRLVEYKGFKYLLEAAKSMPDDQVIVIGGKGPLEHEFRNYIHENNLTDKVFLLGFVPDEDLPNWFAACDLFCMSSVQKTEAFGIVQIEAMSVGKPLISTAIPGSGVAWVNAHHESGLVVPVEDAKALAAAMDLILSDQPLYKKLSEGCLQRFDQYFTRHSMVRDAKSAYRRLLSGKDRGGALSTNNTANV